MSKRAVTLSEIKKQYRNNPVFHRQTKEEDEFQLPKAIVKQARKTGILNLSGKGLAHGELFYFRSFRIIFTLLYLVY